LEAWDSLGLLGDRNLDGDYTVKPILNEDQKAHLLLEIMEWAAANEEVLCATSPQLQVFSVMRSIQKDDTGKIAANNNQVFVRELRKNGPLWAKVLPFLRNTKAFCRSKVVEPEAYYGTCCHTADQHVNGKCQGEHTSYYDGTNRLLTPRIVPCSCVHYKSNRTW
jgi:hypothetical protein